MKRLQQQKGFTLVELAIVLTIIGLLIGGILKGQQLIANARVTAQMSQFQGVEAAVTTFNDTYQGLPGDLTTAALRLPNGGTTGCGGVACVPGLGTGVIGAVGAGPAVTAAGTENLQFWLQLAAANLVSGYGSGTAATFGIGLPNAKVNASGGLVVTDINAAPYGGGHWISATATNSAANLPAATAGAGAMTPNQAAQIDRKMDDGIAITGNLLANGPATCYTAAGVYDEIVASNNCGISYKLQQ